MITLVEKSAPRVGFISNYEFIKDAYYEDRLIFMRLKIERGIDINARGENNETSLMNAVSAGNINAVKLLLESGANVLLRNYSGETAFIKAAQRGQHEIAECLFCYDVDISVKDYRGWDALKWANIYSPVREGSRLIKDMILRLLPQEVSNDEERK